MRDDLAQAVGETLLQDCCGDLLPVVFASHELQPSEVRYSVTEQENLVITFTIQKIDQYPYGKEAV